MTIKRIKIIGGGLAGPEAALQAASLGCEVALYEMRPHPLHRGPPDLRLRRTRLLQLPQVRVRKHRALAAQAGDAPRRLLPPRRRRRLRRSRRPRPRRRPRRVLPPRRRPHRRRTPHRRPPRRSHSRSTRTIPTPSPSSPPARSPRPPLTAELQRLTGSDHLAFYDSISPIVDATTIDMDKVYFAARYDKGTADYINCPFTKEEYDAFLDALTTAEAVPAKSWEQLSADGTVEPRTANHALLRRLPAHRRDRPPRPRHPPLRPHEARRPHRPEDRPLALRRRPAPPGKPPRRQLQPRRLPEPPQVRRAGPRPPPDPRPRERHLPPLRPDPPQHLHPRPLAAHRNPAAPRPSQHPDRRPALRRRGLHRVHRLRPARRPLRRRPRQRPPAHARPAHHRQRLAHPLHHPRGDQTLPARQHHLRPAAAARRRTPQEDPRQERAPPHPVRTRPRPPGTSGSQRPPSSPPNPCPSSYSAPSP